MEAPRVRVLRMLVNALAIVWLLAMAGVVGRVLLHEARSEDAGGGRNIDFYTFLDSEEQYLKGLPIYEPLRVFDGPAGERIVFPNLNHPIVILAMLPLTLVSRGDAFLIWAGAGFAAYLLAVALALRETPPLDRRYLPVALALVLTFPGIVYSLRLGQFGLPLTLVVTAAWLLLRRERYAAAGALLGLLAVLKPFLGLLLILFVVRRRWGALLAAAVAGAGVSLIALPSSASAATSTGSPPCGA